MSKQLELAQFPKPDTSLISIDKVFERMGSIFCPTEELVQKIKSGQPTNKTIRLAKDLAKQAGPLQLDYHDHVRAILGVRDLSNESIDKVKSFKSILFKTVITKVTLRNNKYIIETKKVRR